MLIRGIRQLFAILGPVIFLTTTILVLKLNGRSIALPYIVEHWNDHDTFTGRRGAPEYAANPAQDVLDDDSDHFDLNVYGKPVHEIFSISGKKGKYFPIEFGEYASANPNILPHPTLENHWIMVAQQFLSHVYNTVWCAELVCTATFQNGKLACVKSPLILPIPATITDKCTGKLAFLSFNVGPHDARLFYGPEHPYVMYGSQTSYNCFGLLIQDFRLLTDWGLVVSTPTDPQNPFRVSTELHRPPPYGDVEKNWFIFWDSNNKMYIHNDIYPKRVFAALSHDGTAGPDLAPFAAIDDEKCINRYMPKLPPTLESIHQSTNSLKVTLCKRSDPTCFPTDQNTFILLIFQHKTFYSFHGRYEPYVMLFKQSAPFGIHAISTKPLWIHGRKDAPRPSSFTQDDQWDETEMFYVTSISWKGANMTYHGYMDDEIFIGFGIEDRRSAGIDVVMADILDHLGLCSDVEAAPLLPPADDLNLLAPPLPDGLAR
ncbi:hypothetical protein R6Q59_010204 [Mikania micrantha]